MQTLRLTSRTWMRLSILVAAALLAGHPAAAQTQTWGFQNRVFKDEAGTHKYVVFVPAGYSPARKWPAILFLHGAGERGTDGLLPTTVGLGPLVKVRERAFPFVVVFPQAEHRRGRILTTWTSDSPDGKRALEILNQVEKDFSIDKTREILSGYSMGGFGALKVAATNPERFAAVVTVAGGGDPSLAEKLKDIPLWIAHGAKDGVVNPEASRKIVEAIKEAGGKPWYTEYPEGDHNVWKQAYDDDRLYAWMLSPKSDPSKVQPLALKPRDAYGRPVATVIPDAPFVPAVEIPRAVYVRMGNEMLAALADTIPKVIPPDALSGRLNDISDSTSAEGYTFSVYMSGLSYFGHLTRANVKAYAKDRLNIQLALSNMQVTIGGTSINGESHSASAGPIAVMIGQQRPVWLSFDVTPVIENGKLHLRHVGTSFSIPSDNWYVSGPSGVSVHGFGLTRSKVSNALVSGIYSRKHTIEQNVAAAVPNIIRQIEQKLDLSPANQVIASVWPLPVYKPQLRVWPQEVSTDERGVSLVLGVTAAAVDPSRPPKQVKRAAPVGISVAQVPTTTKLQVGLSPSMLAPLSELLVEADVARVELADTPSAAMAQLSDPKTLSDAIPDLKRYGDRLEVSSELVLAGPINVADLSKGKFAFDAPKLKVLVSINTEPGTAAWKPCAEFDISLKQGAEPQLLKPTALTRAVALTWDEKAELDVKGKFSEGYQPQDMQIDIDRMKALFETGWSEFIHGGTAAQATMADIDLGYTKLRATDAAWSAPNLFATFGPPGIKITNSTDKALVYETKGPYSGWGGPYTLKPGDSHEFPITYPMVYRQQAASGYRMFTLPVGTHSEYRVAVPGQTAALYQAREVVPDEKPKEETAKADDKPKESSEPKPEDGKN